jgi:hypothetical protein
MTDDWTRRAEREAAALLTASGFPTYTAESRAALLSLLACAWLNGVNLGSHETLAAVEVGFEAMQARL